MSKIKLAMCIERLVEIHFSCLTPPQLPLFLVCSLVLYWFAVLWFDTKAWLFFILLVPCCCISGEKHRLFRPLPVLTDCCRFVPCVLFLNFLRGWLGQPGKCTASSNNLCWKLSRLSGIGLAGQPVVLHSVVLQGKGGGEFTAYSSQFLPWPSANIRNVPRSLNCTGGLSDLRSVSIRSATPSSSTWTLLTTGRWKGDVDVRLSNNTNIWKWRYDVTLVNCVLC